MPAVSRAFIYMALGAALLAVAVRMLPRARSPRMTPPEVPEAIRNANETFLDLRNGLGAMRRLTVSAEYSIYCITQVILQLVDYIRTIGSCMPSIISHDDCLDANNTIYNINNFISIIISFTGSSIIHSLSTSCSVQRLG